MNKMIEIMKGIAFILLGILSVFVLDGEGTVALFTVPAGIYYISAILKGEKFNEC